MNNLFKNVPLQQKKYDETPVINSPGWYVISTNKRDQLIKSIIHEYKEYICDIIDIHYYAYYFHQSWNTNNNNNFSKDDWDKISILYNMNPNVAYWIYIKSYNRLF